MQKSHFGLGRHDAAWHLPSKSSSDFCVCVFFPQVFQVCLLFLFSINGLGDDCAAISSTAKAVVSLVEAVLQEFPNGCGRAKNADCIEDRFRTAICFILWLNLQIKPFANCHDRASYQYLTPVIPWLTTFGIQDFCCQTTSYYWVCNQQLPYTCECKNILLDLRRYKTSFEMSELISEILLQTFHRVTFRRWGADDAGKSDIF